MAFGDFSESRPFEVFAVVRTVNVPGSLQWVFVDPRTSLRSARYEFPGYPKRVCGRWLLSPSRYLHWCLGMGGVPVGIFKISRNKFLLYPRPVFKVACDRLSAWRWALTGGGKPEEVSAKILRLSAAENIGVGRMDCSGSSRRGFAKRTAEWILAGWEMPGNHNEGMRENVHDLHAQCSAMANAGMM